MNLIIILKIINLIMVIFLFLKIQKIINILELSNFVFIIIIVGGILLIIIEIQKKDSSLTKITNTLKDNKNIMVTNTSENEPIDIITNTRTIIFNENNKDKQYNIIKSDKTFDDLIKIIKNSNESKRHIYMKIKVFQKIVRE